MKYYGLLKEYISNSEYPHFGITARYGQVIKLVDFELGTWRYEDAEYLTVYGQNNVWHFKKIWFNWIMTETEYRLKQLDLLK